MFLKPLEVLEKRKNGNNQTNRRIFRQIPSGEPSTNLQRQQHGNVRCAPHSHNSIP